MARPPKGKPLTLRPVRLDDDVWAECQKLRPAYGTINEILVAALAALRTQEKQAREMAETDDPWKALSEPGDRWKTVAAKPIKRTVRRGPREKGDKTR